MLAWPLRAATPRPLDERATVSTPSWDTSIRSRCRSSSGPAACTGSGETGSGRLHAVDGMDFPQGPQRRVAAPVLGIDRIAPAATRPVMAIEERGADELHGDGLGEHAVFRPLPVGDEPPQVRPRLPIRAPQLPLRDLGHDAGIGWAVPSLGQLDVPVAVVLGRFETADPAAYAIGEQLARGARRAPIPGPHRRRIPALQHLRNRRGLQSWDAP